MRRRCGAVAAAERDVSWRLHCRVCVAQMLSSDSWQIVTMKERPLRWDHSQLTGRRIGRIVLSYGQWARTSEPTQSAVLCLRQPTAYSTVSHCGGPPAAAA